MKPKTCAAFAALLSVAQFAHGASPLTLAVATDAARAAIEKCKTMGYSVTVTILDPDMSTRVVLRGDDARDGSVKIAYRKAYTVIKTGMSSGDFGKTVPDAQPKPVLGAGGPPPEGPGPVNGDPNLITFTGGLPIKVGGTLLGAMAVSGAKGGDNDELCVKAGLAVIESRLK